MQGTQQCHHRRHLKAREDFVSQDHEVRFEARTERPVIQNTQEDLIESDAMEDAQVRHSDKFDGRHGGTRGMAFGPNNEFPNRYRATCH